MTDLFQRWQKAWKTAGATVLVPDAWGRGLLSAYAESLRAYHNTDHLQDVLDKMDWARTQNESALSGAEWTALELAIFYHDVVYDPCARDNEAQSRNIFLYHAKGAGIPSDIVDVAAGLIDLTAQHRRARTTAEKIMADCDLAIFGAPAEIFVRYDQGIRREYAHVADVDYAPARADVLRGYLSQEKIFKTALFQSAYETTARSNLSTAIARLEPKNTPPSFRR